MVSLLWGCLLVSPPLALFSAYETGRRAQSADEALGDNLLGLCLFAITVLVAAAVAVRTLASRIMTLRDKVTLALMCASVIPLYFLMAATSWYIGWPERGRSILGTVGVLALNALWMLVALRIPGRLSRAQNDVRRDEGPGNSDG
jgi:uncharacterized membrane protein